MGLQRFENAVEDQTGSHGKAAVTLQTSASIAGDRLSVPNGAR